MQARPQAEKPRKQPLESVCEDSKGIGTCCNGMTLSPMTGGRNRKKLSKTALQQSSSTAINSVGTSWEKKPAKPHLAFGLQSFLC